MVGAHKKNGKSIIALNITIQLPALELIKERPLIKVSRKSADYKI